ncbi:unnamed protein product [Dracunculus medinensis]|uniref:Uncharacterized protein n=1 Tax=Dracunculus medinensis TaxID=318479 RepID=A0A0N4U5G0_DRAME|nr:unnamed protein product [Dracunculus medinensis]
MAAPIPYRTVKNHQSIGSFPPATYYRDTYGFQPEHSQAHPQIKRTTGSITTIGSDTDTATTKSTVRTTINIQNLMLESSTSKGTANTPSFHKGKKLKKLKFEVEQMITNQLLLFNARTLLALSLIAFASAIQLLIFATICIFYDGCPYYLAILSSIIFMYNALFIIYFIRYRSTKIFLVLCTIQTTICFICSLGLFVWTAYLIYGEDRNIRKQGWYFYEENLLKINRLISNTRIAMYSLHMILTPIQGLCCAGILKILFENLYSLEKNKISKGYFFTEPTIGHQTVLVPIELKRVENLDESDVENASIGVQTSGNQSSKETNWT